MPDDDRPKPPAPRDLMRVFLSTAGAIGACGLAALLLHRPLLFPSLGPTALLLFETPRKASASVRNTLIGHGAAIGVAWLSLALFGLLHAPSSLVSGVTPARIGAAALAVAGTALVLLLLKASHPPAGATTLIVSLGLLKTPPELLDIAGGVLLLTAIGWLIQRATDPPNLQTE